MPYPVQKLLEGRGNLICVRPQESAINAMSLMIEHDYSQLPVENEKHFPIGMVTYESLLKAIKNFGIKIENMQVSHAIVPVKSFSIEDDLSDILEELKAANAVVITESSHGSLIDIFTSYDSNEFYRRRAEDNLRVEDIETMVKDFILAPFTNTDGEVDRMKLSEAISEITNQREKKLLVYKSALQLYLNSSGQDKPIIDPSFLEKSFLKLYTPEPKKNFEDLTLYEYTELLLCEKRWDFYRPIFSLDREALRTLLNGIRETRNFLAHFHGEITPGQRDQLKFCVNWLARCQSDFEDRRLREMVKKIIVDVLNEDAKHVLALSDEEIAPIEESYETLDSRYALLAIWLKSQTADIENLPLSFEQIEKIIDHSLPDSARLHRSWWANDSVGHIQSKQWLDVGWRVSQINVLNEQVTFRRIAGREKAYIKFFSGLLSKLREMPGFPLKHMSPDGRSWFVVATLPNAGPQLSIFSFTFARSNRFRVELYIDTGDQGENKAVYDSLIAHQAEIETAYGEKLAWERIDEKRASRIAIYHPGSIEAPHDQLGELQTWAVDAMVRFYQVISDLANAALKREFK
jgi:CBS domain-containing protein